MRVKLFRKDTVFAFRSKHSNAAKHFDKFLVLVSYADWSEPMDITRTINGNLIGSNRVVFDLGGNGSNAYRIIGYYLFKPFQNRVYLYIVWIGSHEEYNLLSNETKLNVWNF